ncbi:retropepsin-like aspartic protease [Solitalea lacus]|uniref:retropepsin-like aspartic protease n=1 Tax=Solitalea lacus TaxID=2911172 RepID=UPI001EDC87DE|nr:retropepsin-like aspartic protease [Solitalea lacus]UKJ08569.1 aspartyl protease family protein [Solitalea lacus]
MRKIVYLLLFGVWALIGPLHAQPVKSDSVFVKLQQAFKAKSVVLLEPVLSTDFSVGVYNSPIAKSMLQNIVSSFAVDSIKLKASEKVSGKNSMLLIVYPHGEPAITTRAWLDEGNKLLYVDLFDQLYGLNRYQVSTLQATIPIEVKDGSIFLIATINDSKKPLRFLFDTGADGMAMRKSTADSLGLIVAREQNTSVVGGSMKIQVSTGNTIHFDKFAVNNQSVAIFESVREGTAGIIGITLAYQYIVKVDFDKMVMQLYKMGNYKEEDKSGTTLNIKNGKGILVLPLNLKVGEKEVTGDFVFDTGAGYYVIGFGGFVKRNELLSSGFKPYFAATTVSMGVSSPTFTGNFEKMAVGAIDLRNIPGTLKKYREGDEYAKTEDGSFGVKTISRFNFTINLAEKTIHLTPNQRFNTPVDFMLGDKMFSFNENGNMNVIADIGAEQLFKQGDVVLSINDIEAESLKKEPSRILELQAIPSGSKLSFKVLRDGQVIKISA